jgi:hypothetical protein
MSLHVLRGNGPPLFTPTGTAQHYIDLVAKDVYISVGTSSPSDWLLNNGVGPAGPTGPAGSKWYEGASVPSNSLGLNGDFYLNTANGDVYEKMSGSWGSPIMNLVGPTSVTGSGTADEVTVWNGVSTVYGSSFLKWDNVNKVLNIGTVPTFFPGTVLQGTNSLDESVQFNIQNTSATSNASSDIIATADNGSNLSNFIDMGINGSAYSVVGWSINGADDGYLYTSDGSLAIGTASAKPLQFFTGGTTNSSERMRISPTGFVGIGLQAPQGQLHIEAALSNNRALIVEGASGQTANLQEFRNIVGSILSFVDASGYLTLPGDPTTANMAATKHYVDNVSTLSSLSLPIGQLTGLTTAGDLLYFNGTVNTRLPIGTAGQILTVVSGEPTWAAAPATGVTSVGLSLPSSVFSITVSPITSTGTLTSVFQTQLANTIFAGPTSGVAAIPTFRTIVAADIPTLNQNTTGTSSNITATSNATLTTLSALSLPLSQVTGTLSISNGGTGTTTTSQNFVFVGPTSGSGAPSFRSLTTPDLPLNDQYTTIGITVDGAGIVFISR